MWEKLDIFGWTKKKTPVQPVQREISITLTNGDRQETIQRSPSGTKLASSSSVKHGLEDDDSSEGSTSLNFGPKLNTSTRRNSYLYSNEPLDLPTWSNVTSPGFTSRLVQQASGHSPLKEFNDSLSHSPFRKSPHAHLQLGELPHVSFARKPKLSPPTFPVSHRSLRSGVASSVYNRDRRRGARQGTVFVRIAPIDPSTKANVSLSAKPPSPSYPPRGSSRANDSYRSEGLGGSPQELAIRFTRMWSPSQGTPLSGRPSSPTSPSNIMEALTAGRKRGREPDSYYPSNNITPPPSSTPSKISIGIGDTPVRSQVPSKRVKFLGTPEGHDRPMMVTFSALGGGDAEPLSSESILEQMNQTEKRFLPDSTSTPYGIAKKSLRGSSSEEQSSALHSALRKRRSQTNIMSAVDDEPRGEKVGKLCTCNECYAEAAGVVSFIQPPTKQRDVSTSPGGSVNKSEEKLSAVGEAKHRETCEKGVGTDMSRVEFFRDIFRKPEKKKVEKDDIMPIGKVILTKEMYDRDKQKRIDRYYRLLSIKPPGKTIFDVTDELDAANPTSGGGSSNSTLETTKSSSQDANITVTTSSNGGGFSFGSPPPPASTSGSGGFSFGKQTSPVAPTITTNACTTITSHSSTGNSFVSNTLSSTAPIAAVPVPANNFFGIGAPPATSTNISNENENPTTTTAGVVFGSSAPTENQVVSPLGQSMTDGIAPPPPYGSSTTSTAGGGFNFSSVPTPLAKSPPATPAFGTFGTPTTTTGSGSSTNPAFGSLTSAAATSTPIFGGGGSTNSTGVSFGSNTMSPPQKQTGSSGFSFGSSAPQQAAPASNASSGFSFGQSNPPPSLQQPGSDTGAGFQFGQQTNTAGAATPFLSSRKQTEKDDIMPIGKAILQKEMYDRDKQNPIDPRFLSMKPPAPGKTIFDVTADLDAAKPTSGGGSSNSTLETTKSSSHDLNLTVTTSSNVGGFSFGSLPPPASTSGGGGFSFGKQTSPAAPTITTNAYSTITSHSSTGNSFVSNALSSTAPVAAVPANTFFGISAPPTTSTNISNEIENPTTAGAVFGSSAPNGNQAASPFGQPMTGLFAGGGFNFSSVPNPLSRSSPAAPVFGTFGTPTTTGSGSSTNPAFGSLTSAVATATPIFGGGGSTNSTGVSFGSNTMSPPQTQTASSGFSFGSSAPQQQQTAPASNVSSGFSFGSNTMSPPQTQAGSSGLSFGSSAPQQSVPTSNVSSGFSFGSNTMSPPQIQTGSSGFSFGSNAPQQSAPASNVSSGFAFGQSNPPPSLQQPGSGTGAGFQFGQQTNTAGAATPFQFGQQAAQGVPAGFNFAAAPQPQGMSGTAMFSMGTTSTAPRRRDVRRRHR